MSTSSSRRLSSDCHVVAAPDQVSSDLDGEAVILNLSSGVYFGLDPVGARVWELLQERRTVGDICATMRGEFDVEPERCERELMDLLEQMRTEGLVDVASADQ